MSSSTASSSKQQRRSLPGHTTHAAKGPGVVAAPRHEADRKARTLLTKKGFDPDDIHKACVVTGGVFTKMTPLIYFSAMGQVTMVRYLVYRGADGRTTDEDGRFPLFWAAANGRVETVHWLAQDGGAHEDLRRITPSGISPLRIALHRGHLDAAQLLILLGALAPQKGGAMEDWILRRDLCQDGSDWSYDRRLSLLSWAQNSVAAVPVLLTGTIESAAASRRHPKNPYATRSHKRQKISQSSSLVVLNGKSGILELIAHYVAGTPQQVRTLRQLITLLPVFIANVPFVDDE